MARWMMQRRIFYRYCIMSSCLKFLSRNKLYTAIEAVGLSVRPSVRPSVSMAFVVIIFCFYFHIVLICPKKVISLQLV